VQDEILAQNRTANFRDHEVWFDMLFGDSRSKWDGVGMADPRVVHRWDEQKMVGNWYSTTVTHREKSTWDFYGLCGADAPAWTITLEQGVALAVPQLAAVATTLAGADAAEEPDATQIPAATPTPLPLAPITPTFVSVVGGRPRQTASVTVQAAPGALCSIAYVTPAGTRSVAEGLVARRADGGGRVAWAWLIGAGENPGSGTVTVTCDGASASAEIVIGS
jgi:hypothetical protein